MAIVRFAISYSVNNMSPLRLLSSERNLRIATGISEKALQHTSSGLRRLIELIGFPVLLLTKVRMRRSTGRH